MTLSNPDLWATIQNRALPFRSVRDVMVEPPRTMTCFEHCLRREGDWTDESATRITLEYRKFLYLKIVEGGLLTPPDVIDRAWHLHQCFRDAYLRFCQEVAGRYIPHQTGMPQAGAHSAYARLVQSYAREFDTDPPDEIWPTLGMVRLGVIGQWAVIASLIAAAATVPAVAVLSIWFDPTFNGLGKLWGAVVLGLFLSGIVCTLMSYARPPTIARCG